MEFLGNFISSIIRSRSVNMQKVAENIEGKAKVESNYRRIQRLFQQQEIDYGMVSKLLATILPKDEKWVLCMDRTNWKLGKSNINLLVLAVAYKGMAIPLMWKFLTKEENGEFIGKRGNSNYRERKELMQRFIKLFGVEKIETFTADREFIGKEWFEWLNKNNIPYIIRIRNNALTDKDFMDTSNINELFEYINEDEFYSFGKTVIFDTTVYLGGIKASKANEALSVVSNRALNENTILTYKKRWEIETMFGALKSKGFNLEETKISEPKKIEKLMAFLSIAFVWAMIVGDYRQTIKKIVLKKKKNIQ
jgi:hypothetical protein